ncbi:MAG: hypothetical protein LLF94_05265, partial [Chlamydiales bacterium]|nr:hypothetical protein [Chlamydiales bacterium]
KVWDVSKKAQHTCTPSHGKRGYESWVTAVAVVEDDLFVSGTRDGYLDIWNFAGKEMGSLTYEPRANTVSKARNQARIHCVARNTFGKPGTFFAGASGCFQLWNREGVLKSWTAHENDWVYCIEPLSEDRLITVIGSAIQVWEGVFQEDVKKYPLLNEKRKGKQRAHISAITRLENAPNTMPCALFDGSVRVVDIESRQVTRTYQEHKGRVWSVVEVTPSVLATGADDKCIKLWDLRLKKSVLTLSKNPGRVSALLKLDDTQLISGSCPDDVHKSKEKATLTFWDIKKMAKSF